LQELGNLSSSQNIIPTKIEFVDIAGLVKGASKGEGLGNKFLSNIREVDAIVHVVRCFEDSDVIHVSGKVDPLDDIEIINLELNLADLSQLQKRRERIKKQVRTSKEAAKEDSLLEKIEDGTANLYKFDYEVGKKYIKVFNLQYSEACDYYNRPAGYRAGSVTAFIDKQTGEVYKPASWKAPAKHVRFDLRLIKDREFLHNFKNVDWAGGHLYMR